MLGNVVVYLFLAIILGVAVAWAANVWKDSRAKREKRGVADFDALGPPA